MNIEKSEFISESENSGRDFLAIIKDIKYQPDREKAMQVGDFINMSGKEFKSWISFIPVDKQSLDNLEKMDEVKVIIKEIKNTEDEYGNKSSKLLVEAGGILKEVYASLFYNYGGQLYKNYKDNFEGNFYFKDENKGSGDRPDADIRK